MPVSWMRAATPLPPGFSQVLILKAVKVLCFHALLKVLILNVVRLDALAAVALPV
jgi:hypothetical protein